MFEKLTKWATTPCGESPKKQIQCKVIQVLSNATITVTLLVTIVVVTFFWAR